jgi:hypothetical protein
MKTQTSQNHSQILNALPELIKRATLAQTQLESIVTHFEVTQDGVLRSNLPSTNGTQRFTPQFEEHSGVLLSAINEISSVLTQVTDSIGQVELATRDLVNGVEKQLNVSPVASMREAVTSLDSVLRTRPTSSMPAVKH